ncbi:hypothetical protein EYF80_024633 [Liparis tanakae]|uniref:Uncharacterized protein n=1 Tax=Liparis tanakae TaxID=230148 RepID=A0A4Z2HJL3_9TELE|nr:hypothetical protein EYF80_024633 [Liparis tanakae]
MVTRSRLEKPQEKYLTVQNGAEEVGFVDLLTGRQNHIHVVVAAEGAGVIEIHSTQLLHTRVNIHDMRKETICDEHNHRGINEGNQKHEVGLDDVQVDEGVVAVQGSQQHVHPQQGGSDTERTRQVPESGLREETATLQAGDQETVALILHTVVSWRDFFKSLVITRLYPLSLLEETEDITSQLLSSLSEVPIQKRKDARIAVLHSLQRNVGGPVLKGIEGYYMSYNSSIYGLVIVNYCTKAPPVLPFEAVLIHPYLGHTKPTEQVKGSHLKSRAVGLDVQSYDVVLQREDEGQAGGQQLIFVLLHSHTHLEGSHTSSTRPAYQAASGEVHQVDEGSEVFDLIGQQMSCGVGGRQDMGRIIRSLIDTDGFHV